MATAEAKPTKTTQPPAAERLFARWFDFDQGSNVNDQ